MAKGCPVKVETLKEEYRCEAEIRGFIGWKAISPREWEDGKTENVTEACDYLATLPPFFYKKLRLIHMRSIKISPLCDCGHQSQTGTIETVIPVI